MEFESTVIDLIESVNVILRRKKETMMNRNDYRNITLAQLKYLSAIHTLGNPTFGELKDRLGVTKASVSGIVELLINNGMAGKEQSEDDSRIWTIHLTQKGLKFIKAEEAAIQEFTDTIRSALTDEEILEFQRISGKILKSIKR